MTESTPNTIAEVKSLLTLIFALAAVFGVTGLLGGLWAILQGSKGGDYRLMAHIYLRTVHRGWS